MASAPPTPEPSRRHVGANDYTFYDENFKPMWNRGISRKIGESAFVQQKLPTHRFTFSPYTICPCFLLMGALFTGLGVGIKKFSDNIQEIIIPYTDCISSEYRDRTCAHVINSTRKLGARYMDATDMEDCTCVVNFELTEPFNGTVYMYYALTDFYQNHRDHYLSRDENQLKGKIFDKNGENKTASSACKPLDRYENRTIYPCGLMANSMFTDVIDLYYDNPEEDTYGLWKRNIKQNDNMASYYYDNATNPLTLFTQVPLKNTGIAWESDRMDKYKNPEEFDNAKNPKWLNFTKPRGWKKSLWDLDPKNISNNGVENEDFIVWMRAAAFPWFRKLYRIVDSSAAPFDTGLPKGNYSLKIQYNFDVSSFRGEKKIIITTTTMVAGKNIFLAIVYMGTGALCFSHSLQQDKMSGVKFVSEDKFDLRHAERMREN